MSQSSDGSGVEISVLPGRFAIVKLPAGTPMPPAPADVLLWSATVTEEEVSLICPEEHVPASLEIAVERAWKCLKVTGPLEFELKGILLSLLGPLAEAGLSVFALSTYHTDHIFIKEVFLPEAVQALTEAGHRFV